MRSRWSRVVTTVGLVAAGLVSGLSLSSLLGNTAATAVLPVSSTYASSAREAVPVTPGDPSLTADIKDLARRLRSLESNGSAKPVDVQPADSRSGAALFAAKLAKHAQTAADPNWSEPARAAFASDLGSLGFTSGFDVVSVDCRRHTCVAELEWPSGASAEEGYIDVLHFPYERNCGREIALNDLDRESVREYRMQVLFDCADERPYE